MKAIRIYALTYPFALIASLYLTWVSGRLSLGHWPIPSIDDPKDIGGWFDLPFVFTRALFTIGILIFAGALAIILVQAIRDKSQRKRYFITAVISLLAIFVFGEFIRWDP